MFGDLFSKLQEARERIGVHGNGEVVFGSVGRLVPVKGHAFLLEAFEKVRRE